jgi:cell division protein ZapA (FtsZ GTPase activity inhibitor)
MVLRVLMLWAGWRLLRRLAGAALIAAAIVLAINAIHSLTALQHHGASVIGQLQHWARPLITAARRGLESALAGVANRHRH